MAAFGGLRYTCDSSGGDEGLVPGGRQPNSAVGFEAFVVPELKDQVMPPKTWDRKSSS